jgi:hypothetical protein
MIPRDGQRGCISLNCDQLMDWLFRIIPPSIENLIGLDGVAEACSWFNYLVASLALPPHEIALLRAKTVLPPL